MDQNTEDSVLKRSQRNCCICGTTARKIYLLILLIAIFNIAVWGSLVAAHLCQRNELRELRAASAKAIAECRRHADFVNSNLQQDPRNNMSTQRNTFSKSPRHIERSKEPKNVAPQQAKSKVPPSCPYNSQKRRKLCKFIAKEVSRQVQLNMTELRKEIKSVIDAEVSDKFPKVHASLLGVYSQDQLPKIQGTDMYNLIWDSSLLSKCRWPLKVTNPERCRLTRLSKIGKISFGRRSISGVNISVPGIYFVYCQLTFTIDESKVSENVAHLISEITILMTKHTRGNTENVVLISQIPVLTRQGNNPLITVSMFTQAYLYSNSEVRVAISFRNTPGLPASGGRKIKLYNKIRNNMTYNVFGMYLLKKTDDQR